MRVTICTGSCMLVCSSKASIRDNIIRYYLLKVNWRIVVWGIGLQILLALTILRTSWGFDAFDWLGKRVTEFHEHVDAGSKFLFGETYTDHFFAMKVRQRNYYYVLLPVMKEHHDYMNPEI